MIEGQEGVEWEQWLALALAAEAAGLEGLFRSDHYRSIVRGEPAGEFGGEPNLSHGQPDVARGPASPQPGRGQRGDGSGAVQPAQFQGDPAA